MKILKCYQYIESMSIINPRMCKNTNPKIRIELEEGGEGPIPHLHVWITNPGTPGGCAYIRLDKPEYSEHHEYVSANH